MKVVAQFWKLACLPLLLVTGASSLRRVSVVMSSSEVDGARGAGIVGDRRPRAGGRRTAVDRGGSGTEKRLGM